MNRFLPLILLLSLLLTSCDGWLGVKPYDKISEEQLFSTEQGFEELLNGIYIELNSSSLYGSTLQVEAIEIMGGAYEIGDETNIWGNYSDLKDYDYQTPYWRSRFNMTWDKAYSLILNCNKILTNIDSRKDIFTGNKYSIIKGEALALRAMLHFDMLRLFGPIYSQNPSEESIPYYDGIYLSPQSRLSAQEVMDKVLKDLNDASGLLIFDPIISEGTLMSGDSSGDNFLRFRSLRLNYYAVTALKARANLYAGLRSEAYNCAVEVIRAAGNGIFSFVSRDKVIGTSDPDRIFSTEVLFALSNSSRNQIFLNYFSPNRTSYTFRMESALINNIIFGGGSISGGYQDDYRNRVAWSSSGSNRFFYKYSDSEQTSSIENTMVPMLRLGEMYLIAAEAQGSSLSAGTSYINTLRRNRGISSSISSLTQELLIYEYIRELYGEGQLFYMYKRLNTDIIRSAVDSKNVSASSSVFVVPLPDTEKDN